jgi:DNA recombination protein RmuC
LGRSLGTSVETYNKALGSLERNVIPSMRRLAEVGISSSRELNEIQPIETVPRAPYVNGKDKAQAVELDSRSPSQTND